MKRIALCILALSFAWAYVQCTRAQESKTLDDFKREAVVEVDKSQKLIQEMVDSIFSRRWRKTGSAASATASQRSN